MEANDNSRQEIDEVMKLQEIIDSLQTYNGDGPERREYSLTKGDVILIYRIAKIATVPHVCPFEGDEGQVLHTVAKSINHTQKIAFRVMVTAICTGVVIGLWQMTTHVFKDMLMNGKVGH